MDAYHGFSDRDLSGYVSGRVGREKVEFVGGKKYLTALRVVRITSIGYGQVEIFSV